MLSLSIFLLFVTSALAAGNTNYYGQKPQDSNVPMDYFDDGFNRDLKLNSDSTFSFNFEQTRRDQPPQVEMREENIGRYFYTKPKTTTPASIFSMAANKESQHAYPTSVNNYSPQQGHWNAQQVPAVPPPPRFAFSKPHNKPEPQRNSSPLWNVPAVPQNAYPETPFNNIRPQAPTVHTLPSHSNSADGIRFAPSASYVSDSVSNKRFNVPHAGPTLPSRGNHKFSWNDVKKDEVQPIMNYQQPGLPQTTTPSAPQSIHNKPPPPVPTLSPWYDNFGK